MSEESTCRESLDLDVSEMREEVDSYQSLLASLSKYFTRYAQVSSKYVSDMQEILNEFNTESSNICGERFDHIS